MPWSFDASKLPVVNELALLLGLQSQVVVVGMICAGFGALILSRFTRALGAFTYVINYFALLAGAMAANLLVKGVRLPLSASLDRPLLVSLGGMAVASLIVLLLMPRDRLEDH